MGDQGGVFAFCLLPGEPGHIEQDIGLEFYEPDPATAGKGVV